MSSNKYWKLNDLSQVHSMFSCLDVVAHVGKYIIYLVFGYRSIYTRFSNLLKGTRFIPLPFLNRDLHVSDDFGSLGKAGNH